MESDNVNLKRLTKDENIIETCIETKRIMLHKAVFELVKHFYGFQETDEVMLAT